LDIGIFSKSFWAFHQSFENKSKAKMMYIYDEDIIGGMMGPNSHGSDE
jgi:hypothetical protein